MQTFLRTYIAFNSIEAAFWFALAVFTAVYDKKSPRPLRISLPLSLVAFGLTDIFEVFNPAALPLAVWWAKLIIGVTLFVLLNVREHLLFHSITKLRLVLRCAFAFVLLFAYTLVRP